MLAISNGMSINPMPSSKAAACTALATKVESNGRRHAAMPPGDHLAVLVEAGLDALDRNGVKEVVMDVVLPRPLHLDRRAELLRQQRRFEREVAFRLAPEAAAEQRDVAR